MTSPYSMSRKEGWRRFCDTPARVRPERLSAAALKALSVEAREDEAEARADWHANFGTIATPSYTAVFEELETIVKSNKQDAEQVRGSGAIDGMPGLGKTTIANRFGREVDRAQRRRHGELTEAGHERIPVFRVGLTSNTNLRSLNQAICEFYGPIPKKGSATDFGRMAVDRVLACESVVGIIDDVHFVSQNSIDGTKVNNHFKWLAQEMPITFIYAGVGLEQRRFFEEGLTGDSADLAQTGTRWTRLAVEAFKPDDPAWAALVKAVEAHVVLASARRGDLVRQADYLFDRTGGHIGSLKALVMRGCFKAVKGRSERLTRELLDTVTIDAAAEKGRRRRTAGRARTKAAGR